MPILPLETFVFPEDLLNQPETQANEASPWWVLHTRPRAEKALARSFLGRGLAFFLPLYHRQWRQRGRLFSSYMPLFPGYIFLKGDDEARVEALTTNQIARCLPVVDQHRLQADLADVYRLMASGAPLTAEDRLQPGSLVRIKDGPLAGLEGKVLRRGKQWRVFVEVQFLQRGVSAEVDSWMLEALAS